MNKLTNSLILNKFELLQPLGSSQNLKTSTTYSKHIHSSSDNINIPTKSTLPSSTLTISLNQSLQKLDQTSIRVNSLKREYKSISKLTQQNEQDLLLLQNKLKILSYNKERTLSSQKVSINKEKRHQTIKANKIKYKNILKQHKELSQKEIKLKQNIIKQKNAEMKKKSRLIKMNNRSQKVKAFKLLHKERKQNEAMLKDENDKELQLKRNYCNSIKDVFHNETKNNMINKNIQENLKQQKELELKIKVQQQRNKELSLMIYKYKLIGLQLIESTPL